MPGPIRRINGEMKWVVTIELLPALSDMPEFEDRLTTLLQEYMAQEQIEATKAGEPPAPAPPSMPRNENRVITFEFRGPIENRQVDRFNLRTRALEEHYEPGKPPGQPATKVKWPTLPVTIDGVARTVSQGMLDVPTSWERPADWNTEVRTKGIG